MNKIKPYIELVKKSFLEQIEYKTDFFLRCLYEIAIVIVNLCLYEIIYYQAGGIKGWSLTEIKLLILTAALLDGLLTFFFVEGLVKLPQMILKGEIDYLLVRPINKRLYISFNKVCASQIMSITIFVIYILWCLFTQDYSIDIVIGYIFLVIISMFILYCLFFLIMSLSFWIIKIDMGVSVFFQLFSLGNKPLEIYPDFIKKILIFIIPIGISINFPVKIFQDLFNYKFILTELVVAIIFWGLSQAVFNMGLKHYNSTG